MYISFLFYKTFCIFFFFKRGCLFSLARECFNRRLVFFFCVSERLFRYFVFILQNFLYFFFFKRGCLFSLERECFNRRLVFFSFACRKGCLNISFLFYKIIKLNYFVFFFFFVVDGFKKLFDRSFLFYKTYNLKISFIINSTN